MRALLFTLMSLACSVTLAATVYKWVDEKGVVHYSDQPHANAQKVTISAPQTYTAAPPPSGPDDATAAATAPPQQADSGYQACAISEPQDQSDFANVDALNISVRTQPPLHAGDQIYIMVDGTLVNGGQPTGAGYTLTPVDRGSHSAQALVRNSAGQLVCQSPSVTFNIHQPSIRNPVNPVRPR